MEPTTVEQGQREPPIDAGAGAVRLLERDLWESTSFREDHTIILVDVSLYNRTLFSSAGYTTHQFR